MKAGGLVAALALIAAAASARAAEPAYDIRPVELAPGCYAVFGSTGYFDFDNGGHIVNTGFIVTGDGVVVIDTGPSRRFGEAFRAAIARVTSEPVRSVLITHMHPDHFLGNQAFADVPIEGGSVTIGDIGTLGQDFTLNMYRLSGDWMRGTEPVAPNTVLREGIREIGGHRLRITRLAGHTREDFIVTDETCGVLYAQDLLFLDRAPSTPQADLDRWIAAIDALDLAAVEIIVPGHGPVDRERRSPGQTRGYLVWLRTLLHEAAAAGLDITEVMELPIPDRFAGMGQAREEYQRSVANLYTVVEDAYLPEQK